jgi:hypothetical protein
MRWNEPGLRSVVVRPATVIRGCRVQLGMRSRRGNRTGLVDGDGEFERIAEGIIGVESDADGDALGGEADFAGGVGDGGEAVVGGAHPEVGGELGPALVHVGGAAAVVGFEAVRYWIRGRWWTTCDRG